MKKLPIIVSILMAASGLTYYLSDNRIQPIEKQFNYSIENRAARQKMWDENMLYMFRDPATNSIPERIRQRELKFANALHRDFKAKPKLQAEEEWPFVWKDAGPDDVGGRTRSLAIDVNNTNTVIAGAVSGGVWKTTDNGKTWNLKSDITQGHSVTAIAQDTRPGHTDTWYFGTGEFFINSVLRQTMGKAYPGRGIYKSNDNGESWVLLENSRNENVNERDDFDHVLNMVVSPDNGYLYIATAYNGIFRSTNQGKTFSNILGNYGGYYYSDVDLTADGRVLAYLSEDGAEDWAPNEHGIYISDEDGKTFTQIPVKLQFDVSKRGLVKACPSNPNKAYFFLYAESGGRFFMLDLLHKISEERSGALPSINFQTGYNILLAVSPIDENFVLVGGTDLFRSTNGFTASQDEYAMQVGGYNPYSTGGPCYPNNHPDQHILVFDPQNSNKAWNGNDGGVYMTNDITKNTSKTVRLDWVDCNQGYRVTQCYSASLHYIPYDEKIVCSTQDNGSPFFCFDGTNTTSSYDITFGDGMESYLGNHFTYASIYSGNLVRIRYMDNGYPNNNRGSNNSIFILGPGKRLFFTPFAINPNDENMMVSSIGQYIYLNRSIERQDSRMYDDSNYWQLIDGLDFGDEYAVTAMEFSRNHPEHVLYFALSPIDDSSLTPKIFRLDKCNEAGSIPEEISIQHCPKGGYVKDFAIDPDNAFTFIVVMSNYNIDGVYHSNMGGYLYSCIEGNLRGDIDNPGPAVLSALIMPKMWVDSSATTDDIDGKTSATEEYVNEMKYFLGTTTGLYSTRLLTGAATEWQPEASEELGSVMVFDLKERRPDEVVLAATWGRGVIKGRPKNPTIDAVDNYISDNASMNCYPNPAINNINISSDLPRGMMLSANLYDSAGRLVRSRTMGWQCSGLFNTQMSVTGLRPGAYVIQLTGSEYSASSKIIVSR